MPANPRDFLRFRTLARLLVRLTRPVVGPARHPRYHSDPIWGRSRRKRRPSAPPRPTPEPLERFLGGCGETVLERGSSEIVRVELLSDGGKGRNEPDRFPAPLPFPHRSTSNPLSESLSVSVARNRVHPRIGSFSQLTRRAGGSQRCRAPHLGRSNAGLEPRVPPRQRDDRRTVLLRNGGSRRRAFRC